MKQDKENLSIKNNAITKSKETRFTSHSNLNSKKGNQAEIRKSMITTKAGKGDKEQSKRKSVSPNLNIKSKIDTGLKTKNNLKLVKTELVESKDVAAPVQKISVEEPNNSSKAKRKFGNIIMESDTDILQAQDVELKLEEIYSMFVDNELNWEEIFKSQIILPYFIVEDATLFPSSLSMTGSQLMTIQKFWVLYTDYLRRMDTHISIEKIVGLFNESFKFINEESIIKTYFLKSMKDFDEEKMKEYLFSKSLLGGESVKLNNETYFSMLHTYAQFLLRSNSKNSIHKEKTPKLSELIQESQTENIEYTFVPVKRVFSDTQIISNENMWILSHKEFKTPSIQKETKQTPIRSLPTEHRDRVDPLDLKTQRTESMIISQSTVNKQMDFMNSINLATNLSQPHVDLDNINMSMYPNFTQDTVIEETSVNLEVNQFSQEKISEETYKEESSNYTNPKDNIEESGSQKNILLNSQFESFKNDCSNEDSVILNLNCSKFNEENEEASKKKIEEENLDSIKDLEHSQTVSILNANTNINNSFHSSHSRSRSQRRSKYQSMIKEEFPSDLVEGSIRTFNESFMADSSQKSANKLSNSR